MSGKHIFVLGAGASHDSAGTPLGKDLVWKYHCDCAELLLIRNGVPDLREEEVQFYNLGEFWQLATLVYPLEFPHLPEDWKKRGWAVFDLHEKVKKKHYVDEMLALLQAQDDKQGTSLVRQLIFEHITGSSFDSPNTLYATFVRELLKNKAPQTRSVISLNFDSLLHEEFASQVCFDYLIDFDWKEHNRAPFYAKSNPIPLIKLNGSLDWGTCESCGRLHLHHWSVLGASPRVKTCTGPHCGGMVTPFIVLPHETPGEKMHPLWNVARNHLKEASKVTVIGYSFPEYDKNVRKLFRESLDANAHIEVVDKCDHGQEKENTERIVRKYRRLLQDCNRSIKITTMDGFKGYLDIQGRS